MRLSDLYKKLTGEQREKLANSASVDPGYLWQIATRWRGRRPSLDLMVRLCKADSRLKLKDMAEEFAKDSA